MLAEEKITISEVPIPEMQYLTYENNYPWYSKKGFMQRFLKADSRIAREVMKGPERGTYEHMELLLNGKYSKKGILGGLLDLFFMKSAAGKSIKTRTETAKESIYKQMEVAANKNGGVVNILSLASGSGRENIYPIKKFKENRNDCVVNATFVDFDKRAIEFSKQLAEEAGVRDNIRYLQDNILNVKNLPGGQNDIVTAIGCLEYFDPKNTKLWLEHHVKEKIKPNGVLIATNMEKHGKYTGKLTKKALNDTGWILDYKNLEELKEIFTQSGFKVEEAFYEPLESHGFVIGRKLV